MDLFNPNAVRKIFPNDFIVCKATMAWDASWAIKTSQLTRNDLLRRWWSHAMSCSSLAISNLQIGDGCVWSLFARSMSHSCPVVPAPRHHHQHQRAMTMIGCPCGQSGASCWTTVGRQKGVSALAFGGKPDGKWKERWRWQPHRPHTWGRRSLVFGRLRPFRSVQQTYYLCMEHT